MAGYLYTARRERGDVFKLISIEEGEVMVRYLNMGDLALIVAYIFKPAGVRHAHRRLTNAEAEAVLDHIADMHVGAGI